MALTLRPASLLRGLADIPAARILWMSQTGRVVVLAPGPADHLIALSAAGDTLEFTRVAIHAVVIVAEAAALILAARQLAQALRASEIAAREAAESASAQHLSELRAQPHAARTDRCRLHA